MRIFIIAMLTVTAVSFSDTVTQTDWSGGSGVHGPVTNWGDSYYVSDQINHSGDSLQLLWGLIAVPEKHTVDGSYNGAHSVYAADLDKDGDIDILGAAATADEITWWENADGTGTAWIERTIGNSFTDALSVYAADVDGDGNMDVLGAAFDDDKITWWKNTDGTGTSWIEYTVDNSFNGARSVYATDVDGDGDTDILGAAQLAGEISWWENINGTGTAWTKRTIDDSFSGASSVHATDVDGDGDVDVLGAAANADDITWWENTSGTGSSWTEHIVESNFDNAVSVYATDVDGDGDTDILGAASYDHDITWWENTDGAGTAWTEHIIDDAFFDAHSVYATDVDGDGDVDVLGAAYSADGIAWWENVDGSGTSWIEHTVDNSFNGARSVYAADVNGDGDMDVLGASLSDDYIAWWDLMGYHSVGTLESSILDAGTVDSWDTFAFNHLEPSGTSVGYQFRSSQNSSNMGVWSDTVFTSTSLSGILADSTGYLQYRVILQTTDPQHTPVLEDLSFIYSTYVTATDETNTDEIIFWGLAPVTNPSFGSFAIQVSSPHQAMISLVLHDITGRVVAQHSQELPGGTNSISFNNLAEGVYFCTMRAEDFIATERVVVLK